MVSTCPSPQTISPSWNSAAAYIPETMCRQAIPRGTPLSNTVTDNRMISDSPSTRTMSSGFHVLELNGGGILGELVGDWDLTSMLPDGHSLVHETVRVYKRPVRPGHSAGLSTQAQGRGQEGGSTASGVRDRRRGYISPWLPWSAPVDRPWRAPAQYAPATDNAPDHPSACLLYTSPSPRDLSTSRMPSSA